MKKIILTFLLVFVFLSSCDINNNFTSNEPETLTSTITQNESEVEALRESIHQNITQTVVPIASLSLNEGTVFDWGAIGLSHVTIVKKTETFPVACEDNLLQVYIIGDYRYDLNGYHDSYLAIETGEKVLVCDLQISCFEEDLYSCDVDGDGFDEIIIHYAVDVMGGAGQFISKVYKVVNDEICEIFNSQVGSSLDNTVSVYDTGFESKFKEDKKLEITNRFTGYCTIIDISEKYTIDFFDENGIGIYGNLYCDSFFEFYPKDIDDDGVFELEGLQYTSLTSHADYVGSAKCILKYNQATHKFDVLQSCFISETEDYE